MAANNVQNGALVASEGTWIYYNDNGLCRMRFKDGSNKTELNSDRSAYLNIVGEWIFYENQDYNYEIYKMSFDGSYNQPIY